VSLISQLLLFDGCPFHITVSCYGVTWAVGIERGETRGAAAAVVLQYRGYCSRARGCEGEREPAAGCLPTAGQEGRFFLLNFCLIRLIHLLSLYREVYLTPKLLDS
jgi:hypothetical protein